MIELILNLPWPIIFKYAAKYSLDPLLIASIILAESKGDPSAINVNDNTRWFTEVQKYALMLNYDAEIEEDGQGTSWGLGQITGCVARERGFHGYFNQLFKPEINIKYMTKHLDVLHSRYDDQNDIIASYNAGSPRIKKDGKYVNNNYVKRVNIYLDAIKKVYNTEF